ncbi:protein Glc8p [[Candida] railenensis]|uniref:Protein Glc8p n=1 Tax=[Candida] railenensis TaxID=45579 RepID=A0A9P0QV45_9ASCO|nr:protein Glc8p [[Candida] railenensis]
MTKGILRNKNEAETIDHSGALEAAAELDRQEVIRNTRLNASLTSPKEKSKGDILREKIAEQKSHSNEGGAAPVGEHLKWDELNLYKTEQEKCSTMKIDEPKTPYEGGFNPNGEYYKEDEDEDIPGFELGEGEFDQEAANKESSMNGGEIIRNENPEEGEEEEEAEEVEETAEERHKRFEEMRKQHYHMKGNALHQGIQISDDEDEA